MQMQSQRANATVHAGKGSRKAAILERYRPAQGSSWMWGLTGMTWKPTSTSSPWFAGGGVGCRGMW